MQKQTWDDQLEDIVIHLQTRQARVKGIIQKYTREHVSMNIALSLSERLVYAPAADVITLAAALTAWSPRLFRSMAEEIAQVYQASLHEYTQTSASLTDEFLRELARKPIAEAVHKLLPHYLPILALEMAGGRLSLPTDAISLPLNALISAQLTRRVGVLLAFYFENGWHWSDNSPAKTDDLLHHACVGYASVDDIPFIPEVNAGIITRLLARGETIYEKAGRDVYKEVHLVLASILHLKLMRMRPLVSAQQQSM